MYFKIFSAGSYKFDNIKHRVKINSVKRIDFNGVQPNERNDQFIISTFRDSLNQVT